MHFPRIYEFTEIGGRGHLHIVRMNKLSTMRGEHILRQFTIDMSTSIRTGIYWLRRLFSTMTVLLKRYAHTNTRPGMDFMIITYNVYDITGRL